MTPMPGLPNAQPTHAECVALLQAVADSRNTGLVIGHAIVAGTGETACIHRRSDGSATSWIMPPGSRGASAKHTKGWFGLPTEEIASMRRRLPDHYVPGDQIDFVVPDARYVDARQHIHVQHGTVVHHHHQPVEHQHRGQAHQQTVVVAPTEVRVERRSFWGEVFFGPAKQPAPALAPPQRQETPAEVYRGVAQAIPAQHPAPVQVSRGQPLAVAYQPEMPVSTAAAAFNAKVKI